MLACLYLFIPMPPAAASGERGPGYHPMLCSYKCDNRRGERPRVLVTPLVYYRTARAFRVGLVPTRLIWGNIRPAKTPLCEVAVRVAS